MLKKTMSVILVIVMIVSVFTIVPFTASAEEKSTDNSEYINSTESAKGTNNSEKVQQTTENVLETKTVVGNDTPAKNEKAEIAGNEVGAGLSKADMLSGNLFYKSDYYNNDLALACANLCCDVDNISPYFPPNHTEQYTWDQDSRAFHVGIGYKTIEINGSPRNLIAITCRGTGGDSPFEILGDFFKDLEHHPVEGYNAYFAPYKYLESILSDLTQFGDAHPDMFDYPLVYLVTGHSLGGAAANLLGARLTNMYRSQDTNKVFVYTFGAIKAIDSETNVEDAYHNIFNIYNYFDSFGPHGGNAPMEVSDPQYKFGYTFFGNFKYEESSPTSLENHDMGHYRDVVEEKRVDVTIDRKAGVLDGGQRWTLSNGCLKIYGLGTLNNLSILGSSASWYRYVSDVTDIVIQDGITGLGENEFSGFTNLETIHIPASLTDIGNYAFFDCNSLSDVYYSGTRAKWDLINVDYSYANQSLKNATLHCLGDGNPSSDDINWSRVVIEHGSCGPNLKYVLYTDGVLEISGSGEMTSHPWTQRCSDRIGEVHFPEGLTTICDGAFENCISLFELVVSDNVKEIGNFAFQKSGLTSLTLPNGLETIGYRVLYGNTGVRELTIPGSVTSFGSSTATYYSGADRGVFENSGLEKVIIGNGITSISPMMFCVCKSLREVIIPDSVETIGFQAFDGCSALESINLPNSITKIEYRAFEETGLTTLNLPTNITSIGSRILNGNTGVKYLLLPKTLTSTSIYERLNDGYGMLVGSSVETVEFENGIAIIPEYVLKDASSTTKVILPSSVKEIGNFAFQNSGLTSLSLPEGIETIGYRVLYGNTGVKELTIPGSVTSFGSSTATYYSGADRGVFENSGLEKVIIGNGITSISPMMFCVCKSLREVIIPDSVETIGFQAFDGCSALESINLPNSITKIDYRAFEETGLTTLNLPVNITSIGSRVLNGNTGVKYLLLPKTLTSTSIYERLNDGYGMLVGSSVETVEFEDGIAIIPEYVLKDAASTTKVILPSSVKEIGNFAFQNSGLTSLSLPEGIETIGYRVLYGNTGVKELTIPGSVTSFGSSTATYYSGADRGVFENSGLEKVIIGNGITSISPMMFCVCKSLREVIIPDSVETIGFQAFDGCSALESINLPNSITKIDYRAFEETGLTTLNLPANITSIGSRFLNGNTGVKYLLLPKTLASTSIYERLNNGYGMLVGSSVETVEFEEGIEKIPDNTLLKASSTTNVILPSTIKEIGNSAFENSGLTSLTLPDGVETIGYRVLYGNTGVKELIIPGSVKDLKYSTYSNGGGSFQNSGLEKVTISYGITEISPLTFLSCHSLSEISIPESVETIRYEAFEGCTSLTSIDIPDSVTSIEYRAFSNSGLTEINLPKNIISIGSRFIAGTEVKYLFIPKTFSSTSLYESSSTKYSMLKDSAVETVEFEEGIEKIPDNTLLNATSTTSVILPSTVKEIGNSAFENSGLTSLTLPEGIETIGYRVLYGNTGVKELVVPSTVKNLNYSTYTNGGGTFQNSGLEKVTINSGITEISPLTFLSCHSLSEISIPESVEMIRYEAFENCASLTSIDIPDSVTSIEYRAFSNSGLTEVNLPKNIVSIGSRFIAGTEVKYLFIPKTFSSTSLYESSSTKYAMLLNSSVETVKFEEGIEKIPDNTLLKASSVTNVILPSTVKEIGNSAFESSGLTSLTLPEGIETIGYRVLYGNTGIKELTIPGTVKDMKYNSYYYGGGTFENSGLETVAIEEGVSSITTLAFRNCNYLREITIPFSVNAIGSDVFINCSDLTVTGYTGSYAETFALDNNIRFVSLGEYIPPTEPLSDLVGDVDSDGRVTITDVTSIQRYLAELESLTEEQLALADTNGDGEINIADATHVQMYLAEYDGIVLGKQPTA